VNEDASKIVLQHEFCTIGVLINDQSKVGPGSYETSGNLAIEGGKMVTAWQQQSS